MTGTIRHDLHQPIERGNGFGSITRPACNRHREFFVSNVDVVNVPTHVHKYICSLSQQQSRYIVLVMVVNPVTAAPCLEVQLLLNVRQTSSKHWYCD